MINAIYHFLNWLIKTPFHSALQTILHGDLEYRILRINQFNLSTAKMHDRTFTPFKNIYVGKQIAIVACGPTLKKYQPIPDVVNIGVNRAFLDTRIHYDHIFFQDAKPWTRDELAALNTYRKDTCQKFYGISWESLNHDFPPYIVSESDAIEAGALRFRTHKAMWVKGLSARIPLDISTQPLADFGSVVFSAIQFALWTNPKTIYLVGCDCTQNGHFYEKNAVGNSPNLELRYGYECIKKFASAYYPSTEIVSVNPVGLKGLFRDIYQTEES